ncbi:endonuclease domain-containing protein [Catellatospora sp. NPDC049111]|uniref:endonuclease domain-containing protein n=1 Tax=Catellatospora sp. NPDC049111 TaxID=3155271 RepID=UPI0033C181EF
MAGTAPHPGRQTSWNEWTSGLRAARAFPGSPTDGRSVSRQRGTPGSEHVDHDHEFGNVRGILCFNCNGGLGQFKDNEQSLARAIEYLKETACQRVLVHPGVYQLVSPRRERRLSRTS